MKALTHREEAIQARTVQENRFGDRVLREEIDGYTYLWNVSHALHLARTTFPPSRPLVLSEFGITEALCRLWRPDLAGCEEKAMGLDLCVPQILAPLPDRTVILCCWLRLFKALRLGVDQLPALWLRPEDAESCLVAHFPPGDDESSA